MLPEYRYINISTPSMSMLNSPPALCSVNGKTEHRSSHHHGDSFKPRPPKNSNKSMLSYSKCKHKIIRPMTTETRCCKVFFPNYSRKISAEDTLVPPLWGTREQNVCFFRIICSRCCTRRNLRFHVENCQHAGQKKLTRR